MEYHIPDFVFVIHIQQFVIPAAGFVLITDRFRAVIDKLFANGQVATQYCDPEGRISMSSSVTVT